MMRNIFFAVIIGCDATSILVLLTIVLSRKCKRDTRNFAAFIAVLLFANLLAVLSR